MSHKVRKYLSIFTLVTLTAATASIFGNGCQGPGEAGLNVGASGEQTGGEGGFTAIPGERTASTVYANQILSNMVSCTGIGVESVQARQEWENRKGTLSEDGFATNLTAPMLMGVTAIAGEVCNDLIGLEEEMSADQRNVFNSFDFSSGPNALTESDIQDAMLRMSLSCWQRNLDAEEINIVVDETSQSIVGVDNTGAETRNAALVLCTGILSALSAIEM